MTPGDLQNHFFGGNLSLVMQFLSSMQGGVHHAGIPFYGHHHSKAKDSPGKDSVESPRSVSGPRNGAFCQV